MEAARFLIFSAIAILRQMFELENNEKAVANLRMLKESMQRFFQLLTLGVYKEPEKEVKKQLHNAFDTMATFLEDLKKAGEESHEGCVCSSCPTPEKEACRFYEFMQVTQEWKTCAVTVDPELEYCLAVPAGSPIN
jgi:RNA polymerase subunit RPABC4/transcription elongation factor Spt4